MTPDEIRDWLMDLDGRVETLETIAERSRTHWSIAGALMKLREDVNKLIWLLHEHITRKPGAAVTFAATNPERSEAGALDDGAESEERRRTAHQCRGQ
ncbi:hypothetical protein MINTM005_13750 [Mycobacterium intracellulare]|uniref:hypothetical protein n=1 Tax=Mycobacterium intracellulare TaxID=1767 RepID=UPI001925F339|nr:hypothetical protein [Mycobacterium intracellulare]BCO56131.1 hypothetical protein MINTM005_13750 [Mycobacterium intracellulare]